MNKKILWPLTIFLVGAVAIAEAQQPVFLPSDNPQDDIPHTSHTSGS